ncbi:MAG TPA: DNA polymerase domain-containing protein [Candidatus Saccharimonadales bacterium]|nr:DNA polymerase domain-containing protein [Candidatus Saccharimonadales bacterium]
METLEVHAFDWIIHDKAGDDEQTIIDCWALDIDSRPYLLRITNFPIFCMIELPRFIKSQKVEYQWTHQKIQNLVNHINKLLRYSKIIRSEFLKCQKIYYYQGNDKTPFIRVFFKNIKSMRQCKYLLDNAFQTEEWGWIKCNMWEDDISCVRKLLTIKKIKFSKWFKVKGTKVEDEFKRSKCEFEYIIDWQSLQPIDEVICNKWVTNPGILAWDIETYSDNHHAMPDKYNHKHVVYMISAIYKKYKVPNTLKRYGIIIGDCNQIPPDRLNQCTLLTATDEVDLVNKFADVINETDPDILIGYNILNYDYDYVDHRLKRQIKTWPEMSRIFGENPKMTSNNWGSKAFKNNSFNTLLMGGRISIDLLPIIKRDYKLDMYNLNFVSQHFIKKGKIDIKAEEMFIIYEQMQTAMDHYQSQPNQDHWQQLEDAKKKTTEVMEYCIRDAELCIELMEKLDVWVGMIELSNIVGVSIVDIFTKGQQVRCLSQLYDLAARRNFVINKRDDTSYTFKGGSVQKPIPGLYDHIICLDFKSLYPSIIQALNMCYTTLIAPEHHHIIPDEQCHIVEFDQEMSRKRIKNEDCSMSSSESDEDIEQNDIEQNDIEIVNMHYKIKFYKHKEGLLPYLVKQLVAERNSVRKQQKTETDELVWTVLEKRQWALKITANSFFGFLGVQVNGKLPCMEAAMAITAKGRELIASVGQYLTDKYQAKIVYGDSVTHDMPILIKDKDGSIYYKQIKDVNTSSLWVPYYDDKEIALSTDQVWTEKGWATIHRVIRHKTNKDIYHVRTGAGWVNVTSDHSLITNNGKMIKPSEVTERIKLLHTLLPDGLVLKHQHDMTISPIKDAEMYYLMQHTQLFLKPQNYEMIRSCKNIGKTNEYVYDLETENHHFCAGVGCIVVHNTDSVMIDMNIKDAKEGQYWGEKLSQEISGVKIGDKIPGTNQCYTSSIPGLFLNPLEMEFEKLMKLLCIKPKMYAYYQYHDGKLIEKDGEIELNSKGIPLVRRDKIGLLKLLYKTILMMIMNNQSFKIAICFLIDTLYDLINHKICYTMLKSTRELGSHYKQPSFYMKVFADELRKKNKIVNPGDRLEFLVIIDPEAELVGQRMVLVDDYKTSLTSDKPYQLDYMYYIEHAMMNPIDTIMSIGYTKDIDRLKHITYLPMHKRDPLTLKTPTEMLYYMIKNKIDLQIFKKALLVHIN